MTSRISTRGPGSLTVAVAATLCLVTVFGCSAPSSESGTNPPSSAKPGTTSSDGTIPGTTIAATATTGAVFVDGPIAPLAEELPSIGSMTFTADTSAATSGEFTPAAQRLELSANDGTGYTWTLTIPPGALTESTTITMTPLSDLTSNDIPGRLASGVQLGPDGLQLLAPATLTISGGTPMGTLVVLGGRHDGTEMDIAMPAGDLPAAGVIIEHFSDYGAADADATEVEQYRKLAEAEYADLQKRAKEIIKDPNLQVPRPPAAALCPDITNAEADAKKMADFKKQFADPERVLLSKMLGLVKYLQLQGSDIKPGGTEQGLVSRSLKKATLLMHDYGTDPKYLGAIAWAVLDAARFAQLMGAGATDGQAVPAQLSGLYSTAMTKLLDQLVNQHEYKNVAIVIDLAHMMLLLGDSSYDSEKTLKSIAAAMKFELQLTYTLIINGDQTYVLTTTIPLSWGITVGSTDRVSGSGTGTLTSYVNTTEPDITVEVGAVRDRC